MSAFKTDFDFGIEKIIVNPMDIGIALLNLYNNAFYAVNQKKKNQPEGYEPRVNVSTIKKGDLIEIHVKDNGTGIARNVMDKIFQPFYTNKPTGQGTGLGLSLTYDIIPKAHAGSIKADSQENEFTEFIISLPLKGFMTKP